MTKRLVMVFEVSPSLMKAVEASIKEGRWSKKSDVGRAALSALFAVPASQRIPASTPERTKKTDFYIQPTERKDFTIFAKQLGYSSWQSFALALMRERVYGELALPPVIMAEIAQTNFELSAIGKNLNQIARAINTAAKQMLRPGDIARLEEVTALSEEIKKHLDHASGILISASRRG